MSIKNFKIFKTVCEEGGVTSAAKKLFLTQPAVSCAIKELEKEKGVLLFDRISRRLYLNEAGRALLERVEVLLKLYEEIETINPQSLKGGTIKIGSCITAGGYWLPVIIKAFMKTHPHIKLKVQIAAAEGVIFMLKTNSIDIALLEGPYVLERYKLLPFSSYNIIAVCSPAHKFAEYAEIGLDALLEENLLLREAGSAVRDPFDSFLLLNGRVAQPLVTSVNSQALIQLAKANLGIAILADKVVQKDLDAGELKKVNISEMKITNRTLIAWHQNKYITKDTQDFIDYVICLESDSS